MFAGSHAKMHHFSLVMTLTAFAVLGNCLSLSSSAHKTRVTTSSGILSGFVNSGFPDVRQFLGIPFANPPTGHRRWLPPSELKSTALFKAVNIGPACPQLRISESLEFNSSVYSPYGGNRTEFFPQDMFSEDCLTMNIWVPNTNVSALPVLVWFFGGGFTMGGTNSLYFNPQSWVQRTQAHIVVTVNFRSNIFGFPNAVGITEQNLGLLDQRLALEWIRNNVAHFGGNSSKIISWGQSGGAIAIDYLNFAYPTDPINSGMILQSGNSFYPQKAAQTSDLAKSNFTTVATLLGCGSAASEVDCLRNTSWQDIKAVLLADPTLNFLPVVDNRTVFSNYTDRYAKARFTTVPALIGTNLHEFNEGVPTRLGPTFNQTASDFETAVVFLCTAARTSQFRQASSRTTYRYRYDGNFTNLAPSAYPGAYHASELPLLFGTAGDFHGSSTAYEDVVSRLMQDLWLEFANDPEHGLCRAGWGTYEEGQAVLLGGVERALIQISSSQLDSICNII